MPAKAKPHEPFGPYVLFKKLEADALGDLWRAARMDGDQPGTAVAVRRLGGGHRTALLQSIGTARALAPLLHGTTFVRNQVIDAIDAIPFIAFDYAGGRSLRYIIDRARGGTNATPHPIPLDQAVFIAGRIALSLATTSDMRYGNEKLSHGALIPQFVWVSDDGEIRVAGQHLGKGMIASLQDANVNAEIGCYFSPEYHDSGTPTKASEVYAIGAILFLLVTGTEPPDPLTVTAFTQSVRAAKTMSGQPIPLDVRTVLDKSLILDPASRYPSVTDMKLALDALAAKYAATTFNLAFYLSTLLKKEMEAEAAEREKEAAVDVAAYTSAAVPVASTKPPAAAPAGAAQEPATRRMIPLAIAAAVALLAIGGGAFMFMHKSSAAPSPAPSTAAPAPQPPVLPPPVAASTMPVTTTATAPAPDPNAAKKAFENAVNEKLQEEMLKLQANFNRELQQKKAQTSQAAPPVNVAQARPAPVVEEQPPSALAPDERRISARQEPVAPVPVQQPALVQPPPAVAVQQTATAAPAPAPVQPAVREGDLVEIGDLDALPRLLRQPVVGYPPMALRQHVETTVILTALVSENGDVIDIRVLRGDARFGFNDAAIRAIRGVKFSPPVKDGKRVKTWFPQTVNFKL